MAVTTSANLVARQEFREEEFFDGARNQLYTKPCENCTFLVADQVHKLWPWRRPLFVTVLR